MVDTVFMTSLSDFCSMVFKPVIIITLKRITLCYLQIVLKGLTNEVSKKIPANNVEDIMYAGTGKLLLRDADGVTLFDLQQRK